jgi:hypothetical protein
VDRQSCRCLTNQLLGKFLILEALVEDINHSFFQDMRYVSLDIPSSLDVALDVLLHFLYNLLKIILCLFLFISHTKVSDKNTLKVLPGIDSVG